MAMAPWTTIPRANTPLRTDLAEWLHDCLKQVR